MIGYELDRLEQGRRAATAPQNPLYLLAAIEKAQRLMAAYLSEQRIVWLAPPGVAS